MYMLNFNLKMKQNRKVSVKGREIFQNGGGGVEVVGILETMLLNV
jgi:hypothetical protein